MMVNELILGGELIVQLFVFPSVLQTAQTAAVL